MICSWPEYCFQMSSHWKQNLNMEKNRISKYNIVEFQLEWVRIQKIKWYDDVNIINIIQRIKILYKFLKSHNSDCLAVMNINFTWSNNT